MSEADYARSAGRGLLEECEECAVGGCRLQRALHAAPCMEGAVVEAEEAQRALQSQPRVLRIVIPWAGDRDQMTADGSTCAGSRGASSPGMIRDEQSERLRSAAKLASNLDLSVPREHAQATRVAHGARRLA